MTLGEIFAQGHTVATSREPRRYVVQCSNPPAPQGWWLVQQGSIAAVAIRRRVGEGDIAGTLSAGDMRATHWGIDDAYCWCEDCAAGRKLSETQAD